MNIEMDTSSVASIGDSSRNSASCRRFGDSSAWGGLSASCIADRITTMMSQEVNAYDYQNFILRPEHGRPDDMDDTDIRLNSSWREKICHWSYSVVDHFELSRETVAISIDLFDRYLATRGNRCNGSSALLTSLTTLYIAIKLNEPKKIKLTTLSNLSRGQFFPPDIEEMEYKILSSLSWMVHPPTVVSFVSHLLLFLPQVHSSVRKDIFELSRYLAELSICDAFFVEHTSSTIAYASILNVMDDISMARISAGARARFLKDLSDRVGLDHAVDDVLSARDRLREIFASSMGYDLHEKATSSSSASTAGASAGGPPTTAKSPSSGGHLNAQPAQSEDVSLMGYHGGGSAGGSSVAGSNNRARTNSTDSTSVGSRYSASPRNTSNRRGIRGGVGGWSRQ